MIFHILNQIEQMLLSNWLYQQYLFTAMPYVYEKDKNQTAWVLILASPLIRYVTLARYLTSLYLFSEGNIVVTITPILKSV